MQNKQAKLFIRITLFTATIISLFYVPYPIVWAWIQPTPDTIQEQLEETLDYGFDGVIAYVEKEGQPAEFYAAGLHNREGNIPSNPKAYFKIASISKLYVAVAITKLVKEERISLDNSLAYYFPELKSRIENANKITIRMMVRHRSGIPNFTDNPSFWTDQSDNRKEALEYALDLPSKFVPGEDYGYSNTNYLLLRQLMTNLLGYGFHEYVQAEILDPLSLKHTFSSVNDVNPKDMMSGYYVGLEKDFKSEDQGMVATAEDVGIFLRALNDGSVFKDGEQEIYTSIYVYEHTGLVPGYQSIAKYHKDIDTVVVLFTNVTNFEGYNWNLSEIAYSRIMKIIRKRE